MGDPGGIGPEVIIKALARCGERDWEAVIYGSSAVMEFEETALAEMGKNIDGWRQGVEIVDVGPELEWPERPIGSTGEPGAILQWRALQRAMEAARDGAVDAIVTAPWNKALFESAGMAVVGHTETLADFYGVDDVVMMLGGDRLKVVLVTTHIALNEVAQAIGAEDIEKTVEITAGELRDRFGVEAPKIAVCGLNPHAGEAGHMGMEEIELIEPTIARLRQKLAGKGVIVDGPFPSDTLFAKFRDEAPYDAVVCMYHDQGLIPLKLLHFGESANITLGLPVIRTSVDHGTAYDIAGRCVADEGSMGYAIGEALRMLGGE